MKLDLLRWMGNTLPIRHQEIVPNKNLYVYHHLGLGDMIHCNGMVRYWLSQLDSNRAVHVFCKERNLEMVRWMYRDEPRIVLESIPSGSRELDKVQRVVRRARDCQYVSVGHRALRPLERQYPQLFFDQLFYIHADLPYAFRFSKCYWERDVQQERRVFEKLAPKGPYAFVHDDPQRGYHVDCEAISVPVIRNDVTESIFHLGMLLENASEVHCMESSIRCMIESLDMSRSRLYYHNFRYPDRPLGTATRHAWREFVYPVAA